MITVKDIAAWPEAALVEIRAEVKKWLALGYPLRYLRIASHGKVLYDDIGHAEALMCGADPESDCYIDPEPDNSK